MCNNFSLPPLNVFSNLAFRWTPRIIVSTAAGYYSLGFAYEKGVMALIDRIAIQILLPRVGYIGLGAVMPTVQWYAAWAVRIVITIAVALLYDLCERMLVAAYRYLTSQTAQNQFVNELTTRLSEPSQQPTEKIVETDPPTDTLTQPQNPVETV